MNIRSWCIGAIAAMAMIGGEGRAMDMSREWRNWGVTQQTIVGRGMTFNVFYAQDMNSPDWGPPQPDATGNPGRTYAEQYKHAVGRALQWFADELVSAEPFEVVVDYWEHGSNWGVPCYEEAYDRPTVVGTRYAVGGFDVPGYSVMPAPPGVAPGMYPLTLMVAMTSRAQVAEYFPEVLFTPDLRIHEIRATMSGVCGPETFWMGVGAPPPGKLSFEAAVMRSIAAQLGWEIWDTGKPWPRNDGGIHSTPVMERFIRNVETGQWMRDITPAEQWQWRHAEPAVQLVGPKLLEQAKRMGVVSKQAQGVPIAAAPKRYLGFHAGLEWTGINFTTPRFHVFAASVAPADALVDVMQPNPDWGIELTAAMLEDMGWRRYRAPEEIPCSERDDCLFSDSFAD